VTWAHKIVCRKCNIAMLDIDGGIDGCAVNVCRVCDRQCWRS